MNKDRLYCFGSVLDRKLAAVFNFVTREVEVQMPDGEKVLKKEEIYVP